jgi:hypothetical protein
MWRSERGSASLEFIAGGVLLLVPLIYLVLMCGRIQAASLAAEGIARQSVRVIVTAPTLAAAQARMTAAVRDGLGDFSFANRDASTAIACTPTPTNCLAPQSLVTVTTTIAVALPGVPSILGLDKFAKVSVSGSATQRVAVGAGS